MPNPPAKLVDQQSSQAVTSGASGTSTPTVISTASSTTTQPLVSNIAPESDGMEKVSDGFNSF